jgi:hypothetical protein
MNADLTLPLAFSSNEVKNVAIISGRMFHIDVRWMPSSTTKTNSIEMTIAINKILLI